MKFEMIREIGDTVRQDGDLDLRRPRIGIMLAILFITPVFASFVRAILTPPLLNYDIVCCHVFENLTMATTPVPIGSCPCTKPIPTNCSFESLTRTVRRISG